MSALELNKKIDELALDYISLISKAKSYIVSTFLLIFLKIMKLFSYMKKLVKFSVSKMKVPIPISDSLYSLKSLYLI